MNKMTALVTVIVLLAVVLGASFFLAREFPRSQTESPDVIRAVAPGAFGALTGTTTTAPTTQQSATLDTTKLNSATGEGTSIMPAPTGTSFQYAYAGAPPSLPATVDVLAWTKHAVRLDGVLRTTALDAFDFSRTPGSALDSLSATTADGYRVDVNIDDGTVSIYDTTAQQRKAVAAAESSEGEILATAQRFLSAFGISTAGYGTPIVQRTDVSVSGTTATDIRTMPETLPAQANVLYPLVIDGKDVSVLWGGTVGMTVAVDLSQHRVTSAYGIRQLSWESSAYDASSRAQFLLDLEQGGIANFPVAQSETTQKVPLGSPKLVYTSVYTYTNGASQELLVPAYRFPVTNPPAGALTEVIVPLVPNLVTRPTIEPAILNGGSSGSSGASTGSATPTDQPVIQDDAVESPSVIVNTSPSQ